MKYKRRKNIHGYCYNPCSLKNAQMFINMHNLVDVAYFTEDGLEDEDKTGSLELSFYSDGITLNFGQYFVILEDGHICVMSEREFTDFAELEINDKT